MGLTSVFFTTAPPTFLSFSLYMNSNDLKKYLVLVLYLSVTEPNYVTSLEHEGMVYFFFREVAVEYINCGKVSSTKTLFIFIFSFTYLLTRAFSFDP